MCELTEKVIFTEPYTVATNNRHTSPQLDADVAELRVSTGGLSDVPRTVLCSTGVASTPVVASQSHYPPPSLRRHPCLPSQSSVGPSTRQSPLHGSPLPPSLPPLITPAGGCGGQGGHQRPQADLHDLGPGPAARGPAHRWAQDPGLTAPYHLAVSLMCCATSRTLHWAAGLHPSLPYQ